METKPAPQTCTLTGLVSGETSCWLIAEALWKLNGRKLQETGRIRFCLL
jgi:hypothetical protein